MMPDVIAQEELYNKVRLAGVPSPGVVTLSGHKRNIDWDVKAGGAQDGASITRKGKAPSEFTATFYLVKDLTIGLDEFLMWELGFLPVLKATFDGTLPQAVDIYHPDLALLDIKSVVVKSIGGLEYDGKGGARVSVTFLEYVPPKKKTAAKPKGSSTIAAKPGEATKPDPNAAAKATLDALLAEAKRP